VYAIKNGWEETDSATCSGTPTLATDEHHMERVKCIPEHTRNVSCRAIATEVGIFPASVYCLLTNSLGKQKIVRVDSTCAEEWPESYACSCCHWSVALVKWRQCIPQLHIKNWRVMDAFIWPSAEITECWKVWTNVTKEDNCMAHSGCSESHAHHILQQKCTCAWPSCANWCHGQWPVLLCTLAE